MNPTTQRAAKWSLFLLATVNLFNYLDRYIVSALVESLKKSELALTDTQAGFLMTGFILVYMTTSPIFGYLGDRFKRPRLMALGITIWSLATFLSGFAKSFAGLFIARAAVGVGEGAYGTIAPAILSDYFPKKLRGRVFAFFFAAIPIGSALGYVLGGFIDQHFGWRMAFFVAGLPGLVLALCTLFLNDPPRGGQEEQISSSQEQPLYKNFSYAFTILGYAAYTFALGGLAFWMPAFLERVRGLPKQDATVQFGLVVVITGFIGTFAGGWLGDKLLSSLKNAYLWLSGIAALIAAPFAFLALSSQTYAVYFTAIIIAELLLFLSTGPINSAIANSVSPAKRAFAFAACNFWIHILGDVPSPAMIGAISDASSLSVGVLVVPVAILLAGIIWIYAAIKT